MDLARKFCELPLNNKIVQELQALESSIIGQVPYFMLKRQEENMKVESNFYKQNPQYKVLGAILEGVSKGELELHIESIQVETQNIKALLEKLPSSLTELKNILSDLLKLDAENNLNTSNVTIIDNNEVEVNCLGNGNDDD